MAILKVMFEENLTDSEIESIMDELQKEEGIKKVKKQNVQRAVDPVALVSLAVQAVSVTITLILGIITLMKNKKKNGVIEIECKGRKLTFSTPMSEQEVEEYFRKHCE